jgi:hypothetical protein
VRQATNAMWWCHPDIRPRLVLRHPQVALARSKVSYTRNGSSYPARTFSGVSPSHWRCNTDLGRPSIDRRS